MMRIRFNFLIIVPSIFFLERDVRTKMLAVSTRLLDIGIMEIYLETIFDFGKHLVKKSKMSLYGENLWGDNLGILGPSRGQKNPNHE